MVAGWQPGNATPPGQYVMAWLPDVGEKPFSLHSAAPLALTICAVGPVSRAITALNSGDTLWIRGPLGKGFSLTGKKSIYWWEEAMALRH